MLLEWGLACHDVCVAARGQVLGAQSCLPSCGSQGWKSGFLVNHLIIPLNPSLLTYVFLGGD